MICIVSLLVIGNFASGIDATSNNIRPARRLLGEDETDDALIVADEGPEDMADMEEGPGDMSGPGEDDEAPVGAFDGTLKGLAEDNGSFTSLLAAASECGLVSALDGTDEITVLAPNDESFKKALGEETVDAWVNADKKANCAILNGHVIQGKVLAKDIIAKDGEEVTTMSGAPLTIKVDGENVMLSGDGGENYITVTDPNLETTNGVLHIIDGVIMPSAPGLIAADAAPEGEMPMDSADEVIDEEGPDDTMGAAMPGEDGMMPETEAEGGGAADAMNTAMDGTKDAIIGTMDAVQDGMNNMMGHEGHEGHGGE